MVGLLLVMQFHFLLDYLVDTLILFWDSSSLAFLFPSPKEFKGDEDSYSNDSIFEWMEYEGSRFLEGSSSTCTLRFFLFHFSLLFPLHFYPFFFKNVSQVAPR